LEDIINAMNICLNCTYFKYNDEIYEQTDGCAMGNPLSTICADIFMQKLESVIVDDNKNIKFYGRFVDDILSVNRARQTQNILKNLNSFHHKVQFTHETEKDGTIPFLDILIKRTGNGKFEYNIYRKPTHTDKYLDWDSIHPSAHKTTVVNTLVQRALKICSEKNLQNELAHIKNVLINRNNYPKKWVTNSMNRVITEFHKKLPKLPEELPRVILPYVKGLTESVARLISRQLGNPLGYIPFTRMADILTNHKDKSPSPNSGVYAIKCSCGHVYIGQTGRELTERLKEHQRHCRNGDPQSAVAEHVWNNISDSENHVVNWSEAKVILKEPRKIQREIKESCVIKNAYRERIPLMNRKEERGRDYLPNFWNSLLSLFYTVEFK
jgi:predicted GIY-YIG superfamily endonuclease